MGAWVVVKEEGGEKGSMNKCLLINVSTTNELVNQLFFKIEEFVEDLFTWFAWKTKLSFVVVLEPSFGTFCA